MEQLNKIAVIGGTGKAGKYLVNRLIDQDFKIKVLVRNPDRLNITNPLIEKVIGDVRNYESVYSLIEGCGSVVSTLGQTRGEYPIFSQAATNIVKAMDALNVNWKFIRTIFMTAEICRRPDWLINPWCGQAVYCLKRRPGLSPLTAYSADAISFRLQAESEKLQKLLSAAVKTVI